MAGPSFDTLPPGDAVSVLQVCHQLHFTSECLAVQRRITSKKSRTYNGWVPGDNSIGGAEV